MAARIIDLEELRTLTGKEVGATSWLVVDQRMIDAFAEATGDRQGIHVDTQRAKAESKYGRTIAHGFLTLEDNTEVFYQMSEFYDAESARGVRWDDPAFQIFWPQQVEVISERDRSYVNFE